MKSNDPATSGAHLPEVIISRENAVFWMDDRGRWCNRHGRFTHKRIIDHFNRAIRRDEDGYYLTQTRGDIREKVYFNYVGTPLFVRRVITRSPIQLVLNTGEKMPLDPTRLFVEADQLYLCRGDERIRFDDRSLMAMAPYLDESEDGFCLRIGDCRWPIPAHAPAIDATSVAQHIARRIK